MSKQLYYKYRGLKELKRFLEIIVQSRLYGASYNELNDRMEGRFDYSGLGRKDFEEINRGLKHARICSFVERGQDCPNDYLMWSHYGEEHKGCCIEFAIPPSKNKGWELVPVNYSEKTAPIQGDLVEKIRTILSYKSLLWQSEREVRAIHIDEERAKTSQMPKRDKYLKIEIKAIYLGEGLKKAEQAFYCKLIKSLNPKIAVYRMCKDEGRGASYYPVLTAEQIEA